MRYARFMNSDGPCWGVVGEDWIGSPYGEHKLADVRLLPPCEPTKIVCVGLNYRDHAEEMDMVLPSEPLVFLKPTSALIGSGETIRGPLSLGRLDFEEKLCVVVGRKASRVPVADAGAFLAGYTVGNDVTARDFQLPDSQWTKAKSYDSFAPLGPFLVRDFDPHDAHIETRINGVVKQQSTTKNMAFSVAELVSYISSMMTLFPGDVLMTGTPPGVGAMDDGDLVEISIDGLSTLSNVVERTET